MALSILKSIISFFVYFQVTLIEVLPKEKKQKEEKVQIYGQAVVDLFDLIKGHTDISIKRNVYATPGSSLEAQSADLPLVNI